MLKAVRLEESEVYHLPGRDVRYLVGPKSTDAKNMTVGLCTWPEGSAPDGHIHEAQEETIYILKGSGKLSTPEGAVDLAPGTAVYIPIGLHHAISSAGPGDLEFVTMFSPPVVFGAYSPEE